MTPTWACGDPSSGPGATVTGVWATNLTGDYVDGESSALDSPSISLVGCEGMPVAIEVRHWYETEPGFDGGNFSISVDGGNNWTVVEACGHPYDDNSLNAAYVPPDNQPGFTGRDATWHTSTIDLSPYLGEPDVRLRLVFGSDASSIQDAGWYIDTIEVTVP